MKTVTKPVFEAQPGDIWVCGTERTIMKIVPDGPNYVLVLFKDEGWVSWNTKEMRELRVPEWNDLTDQVVLEIAAQFLPGYSIDREAVEPLWQHAVNGVEDYVETRLLDDRDVIFSEERKRRLSIQRVMGAIEMLYWGSTGRDAT